MFSINLETGETKLIADDPRADIGNVMAHPTEKTIQAVSFNYTRDEWRILDDAIRQRRDPDPGACLDPGRQTLFD